MAKPKKLNLIKPVLKTDNLSDAEFVPRLYAVHDGIFNNPANYPTPPVDMTTFKGAIDVYGPSITAALDGGTAAVTALEKNRVDVTIMYRLLGHYVEAVSKGDMKTFVSSGFVAAPPPQRTAGQPVSVPSLTLAQGGTGQLMGIIKPVKQATSYGIRFAADPAPGAAITWTMFEVARTRPAVPINNLTRGVNYTVQVRALGTSGYSDWSSPVERMCI